jgi:hypothetical protein
MRYFYNCNVCMGQGWDNHRGHASVCWRCKGSRRLYIKTTYKAPPFNLPPPVRPCDRFHHTHPIYCRKYGLE